MILSQEPIQKHLPGVALQIALTTGNMLCILTRDERQDHHLAGFDLSGNQRFVQPLTFSARSLRLSTDGTIWAGCTSQLQQYDDQGRHVRSLTLPCRKNEALGNFLLLDDGFIVIIQNESSRKAAAAILRLDSQGNIQWSTPIIPEPMSLASAQESPERPPWRPRMWVAHFQTPLLLNGQTLLVHLHDFPASGIGIVYAFDPSSGAIRWALPPRPYDCKAIAGPDRFLIGAQGYGAFDTWQYDTAGANLQYWPSHGYYLLTENNEIRLVEMENISPSRMHFAILKAGGSVEKGPHLPGYYTSYPIIDKGGNTVFWRKGELILIDQNMEMTILASENTYPRYAFPSRMLLDDQGNLIFALEDELRIYPAGLEPLANSPWAIEEGSLLRNPVQ